MFIGQNTILYGNDENTEKYKKYLSEKKNALGPHFATFPSFAQVTYKPKGITSNVLNIVWIKGFGIVIETEKECDILWSQ